MNSTSDIEETNFHVDGGDSLTNISSFQDISKRLHQLGLLVYQFYTPILCIVGTVGNSLAIIVFLKDSKYRKQSSSYYLSTLAVSDTLYLCNLFAVWLGSLTHGVITYNIICPLVMYIGHLTSFVTVYLTMAFSLERYIAIYFPLRRPQICTIAKTKMIIAGIITIGSGAFTYVWGIAEVIQNPQGNGQDLVCAVADQFHNISEIANYLDTIFVFILPFFVITFLNLKVVIKLCQKEDQQILDVNTESENSNPNNEVQVPTILHKSIELLQTLRIPIAYMEGLRVVFQYEMKNCQRKNSQDSRRTEIRVTKILLLISTVFLILNLPLHLLRCSQFIQQTSSGFLTDGMEMTIALQPWGFMLFNTNFAVNLLLYSFSGTQFRSSIRNIFNFRKTQPK